MGMRILAMLFSKRDPLWGPDWSSAPYLACDFAAELKPPDSCSRAPFIIVEAIDPGHSGSRQVMHNLSEGLFAIKRMRSHALLHWNLLFAVPSSGLGPDPTPENWTVLNESSAG
jgi:hypothetical protein